MRRYDITHRVKTTLAGQLRIVGADHRRQTSVAGRLSLRAPRGSRHVARFAMAVLSLVVHSAHISLRETGPDPVRSSCARYPAARVSTSGLGATCTETSRSDTFAYIR
jgi:hypothetical protein